jgi:hypothetical protein
MNIEFFDVSQIGIVTKKNNGTKWVDIAIVDKTGKQVSVITLFSDGDKAITLKLGEDE